MGLLDGILLKMMIFSFHADDNGLPKGIPIPYPVMYNPEKFSKNVSVNYQSQCVPGDNGQEQSYHSNQSGEVTFEFFFDATGTSINSINGEVAKAIGGVDLEIELFLELMNPDPEEHKPRVLTLVWGTFIFNCKLKSAQVNYTLFSSVGRPLRATVTATFIGHEFRILRAALSKLFSSDLTKVHIVKAGETLPLIANKVYGDPSYYIQIAKANNLLNFRNIKPGQEIILPPVEKQNN
ncbi:LysM peptidoglycan-binding domain-containing protein [Aquimarina sp. BL5]|uniref:CIS tube protein n=1 Tax=Aquimarina sp. BL5 TaxID=1714860 RepID=UPI000E49B76C|nr:LysM peptidoglycan-binding domain-containing protein [Aquimarina sp. BL5]AXT53602.1 LysM peptidoglycan-binding domain-containing protein [Aquimarina sp. BL5]RKN03873.1 LysM peptidoglycan-binding domain-containing protein [Aquimarina sp. BL5]